MGTRLVVALFGPSGAGKTTIARSLPLTVFDRDDPQWSAGETVFRQALKRLRFEPDAQAVAIRSGATSSARARAVTDMGATHAFLVIPSKDVCHYQAGHRRRQDVRTSHASIETWYAKFDHHDGCPMWPGSWEMAQHILSPIGYTQPRVRDERNKAGDPRGTRAWRRLREQVYAEETHCWKCCTYVDQTLPPRHPKSRTVDHLIPIAMGGAGVPPREQVRLACWSCNSRRGAGRAEPIKRESLSVMLDSI
ncbi:HNH endonuclease [Catelliglobosispora koreensis]|uniref:HNH endonuclease n=1 Tax=Catelliglobosispora koreensis TaxID=129052 RepID=UPI00036CC03D|nr:HNH endonuclease signature motif containing protein [Catelliglobosispora koreensis]